AQAAPGWMSEIWRTRRGRLFLMAGDSPIGFRLPLQSLPKLEPTVYPHVIPADPFAPRGPLPGSRASLPVLASVGRDNSGAPQLSDASVAGAPMQATATPQAIDVPVRTALTVEIRDGRVCVFVPPVERLEDYLELITIIEATAERLGVPIQLEGYPP